MSTDLKRHRDSVPSGYEVREYVDEPRHKKVRGTLPGPKIGPPYFPKPYGVFVHETWTSDPWFSFPVGISANEYWRYPRPKRPQYLYAQAYDRAVDKLTAGDLEMGMNLATLGKTTEMIAEYSMRYGRGLRALRHGRFEEAATAILKPKSFSRDLRNAARKRKPKKHPYYLKDVGEQYLVYTYGFEPMWNEIVKGRNALDIPEKVYTSVVRGRAKEDLTKTTNPKRSTPGEFYKIDDFMVYTVEVGFWVSVDNPNHLLLNRLGLSNPFIVINDLIPFSFVVNWWTSHEQWLSSLDAFYGYRILSQYFTTQYNNERSYTAALQKTYGGTVLPMQARASCYHMVRSTDVPRPGIKDRFRAWPFASWRRSLNGAALTQQQLARLASKHH